MLAFLHSKPVLLACALLAASGCAAEAAPEEGVTGAAVVAGEKYACPMHPDVESDRAGQCPKCGMALVPAIAPDVAASAHDARPPYAPMRPARWFAIEAWMGGNEIERAPTLSPTLGEDELIAVGGRVFALYCVNCHGQAGRGDGPRSPVFDPPPRDLTRGVYKFRSTPTGLPPTREDLFRTITGGLAGTGMPPFADLPEVERWALVSFVRSLAPARFARERQGDAVTAPPVPSDLESASRRQRGRDVFRRLGCTDCHGERGRGDGPSAPTLRDDDGLSVRTPDFAVRPLKRDESPEQMFLTLLNGLDGTPMPSFEAVAPDDLWDAIAFVRETAIRSVVTSRDVDEGRAMIEGRTLTEGQQRQAAHAVVDGCGCKARRAQQAQAAAEAQAPGREPLVKVQARSQGRR